MTLAHSPGILSLSLDPSGQILVSADSAGLVCVTDARNGTVRARLQLAPGAIHGIALCPNRLEVAIAQAGQIHFWDVRQPQPRGPWDARTEKVLAMRYDGDQFVWVSVEGSVYRSDPASAASGHEPIFRSPVRVRAASISTNAARVAMSDHHGGIRVDDVRKFGHPWKLEGHRDIVCALDFHPNRPYLAAGGRDCFVKVWDLDHDYVRLTFSGHTDTVTSLAFSEDGGLLASGDASGKVNVWRLSTQTAIASFQTERQGSADAVAVSGRSLLVTAAGLSPKVHCWDLSKVPEAKTT